MKRPYWSPTISISVPLAALAPGSARLYPHLWWLPARMKENLSAECDAADSVALAQRQQLHPRNNLQIPQDYSSASTLSGCLGSAPAFTCRYGTPSFWSSTSSNYIYFARVPGPLLHNFLNAGILNTAPASQSPFPTPERAVLPFQQWAPATESCGQSLGQTAPGQNKERCAPSMPPSADPVLRQQPCAGNRDALSDVPDFITPPLPMEKVLVVDREPSYSCMDCFLP